MKELLKKLSDAKKEIGKISKDSSNPFFKSKYFDINKLLEHVEPILEKHGLMIMQPIKDNRVQTIITHLESGENIDSSICLPDLNDPQKIGSAITYYRRYTLQSLLALQAEDDDGNKAAGVDAVEGQIKRAKTIKELENIWHGLNESEQQKYKTLITNLKTKLK